MQITINLQTYQFDEQTSLETAIQALEVEAAGIAVALNEEIIPKSNWSKTVLCEEDKIIIIGAVAGG